VGLWVLGMSIVSIPLYWVDTRKSCRLTSSYIASHAFVKFAAHTNIHLLNELTAVAAHEIATSMIEHVE